MWNVNRRIKRVIYSGLLWGSAELVAGYFLHNSAIPLSGALLMPVGIICMEEAYLATGRLSAAIAVSVMAALMKLMTLFIVPSTAVYLVVNPAAAILLEGFILAWPLTYISKASQKSGFLTGFLFCSSILFFTIFIYKLSFLSFQAFLRGESGAPVLGGLSIADNVSYLITETFVTVFIIVIYMFLRNTVRHLYQKTLYL